MRARPLSEGFCGRIDPELGIVAEPGPVVDPASGCQILVWGQISNRAELKSALALSGDRPGGDAALVGHAYRRWGEQFPNHVHGEYSAAVFDLASRTALLAHDSMGLSPLYHSLDRNRGQLRFATHLLALLDLATTCDLDHEYFADYVARGAITTARTPFRAVRRLLPGTILLSDGADARIVEHWRFTEPLHPAPRRLDADEQFRSLLESAVGGAFDGARTVWSDLSGGLDSTTVFAMAARLGAPNLAARSVYCPGFYQVDERRWMRDAIALYPVEWHLLDLEETLPFSGPPTPFAGEPSIAAINGELTLRMERICADHGVDILLSGHGGDAVLGAFCGSEPVALADPLFSAKPWRALSATLHWRRESPEGRSLSHWLRQGVVRPSIQHLFGRGVSNQPRLPLQPWLKRDFVRSRRLDRRRLQRYAPRRPTPGAGQIADSLWVTALHASVDVQRRRGFHIRHPLLDPRLVSFMTSLPLDLRMRPRCDRYLQRRALAGILPESVRRRGGKGVATAMFVEGLSRSPEWVRYLTEGCRLADAGIADANAWADSIRQATVGQTRGDMFLHAGISLEIWLRQLEEHRQTIRLEARRDI
ncbi:MAG TPA: asparagine synthase-related protein [Allosphingosinicella sp.]|jgi:asparagine synthase (glutamine-hydrolysing)